MERRTVLRTLAGTGLGIAVAGCLEGSAGTEGDHDVGMSTRAFLPQELEVPTGTTVLWRNTSSHAHTVTAYDDAIPDGADYFASGDFDSEEAARDAWPGSRGGAIDPGDAYEHTFEVPGTYGYVCIPHERSGMVGTIYVGEDAGTGPGTTTDGSTDG